MNRHQRMLLAQETLVILTQKRYTTPEGLPVDLTALIDECARSTRYLDAPEARALIRQVSARPRQPHPASIEVVNETTLAGLSRALRESNDRVAALNFASARNPGGGFLGGSLAQEESLASSSALYSSLLQAPEFYERHRAMESCLYSDALILSPDCPVFRADDGGLMQQPELVTFITCAAPNAGAVAKNQPSDIGQVEDTLCKRAEFVLALAALQHCPTLILGAWGCGVFRNDPAMVARAFRDHLYSDAAWAARFDRVIFSVFDTSAQQKVYETFKEVLAS
ncbi:TIGR02452 family protein [Variovorax sp. YR750]|uniref:TIGR02452 family protein n=1 Tax=Variovorax sp. YR750 TaxID=1884384 RepID=UPI000B86DC5B|nr:TIGR02452 family protein [Variovorax sp. YR750]